MRNARAEWILRNHQARAEKQENSRRLATLKHLEDCANY